MTRRTTKRKGPARAMTTKPNPVALKYARNVRGDAALPTPVSARVDSEAHVDGWSNLLTGLGYKKTDKKANTTFIPDDRLTYIDLTYLYRSEGLAKRVIDLQVDDMYRAWFKIDGDTEGKVDGYLKKIRAKTMLKKATRWAKLFGGAVAVLGIDDGRKYDQPVNEANIRGITHIHVFDRYRVNLNVADLYTDPTNEKYGEPELYPITPLYGAPFSVHESRVLRFDGEDVTDVVRIQNQGWGDPVLQSCWDRLRALGGSYGNIETILDEFILGVMTIGNLQEMFNQGNEALAKKRLNYVDMTKHIMNTILIDKEEEFARLSATVTGIGELVDKLIESMCAVTGYPVSLLMGRSQGGLSSDDASQVRYYYDKIASQQEEEILPPLEKLIRYCNIATKGPLTEDSQVKFEKLWQPTLKETTETRKAQAETDKVYIDAGVVTPEEVALSRFGGDTYSHDTVLDEEHASALESGDLYESPAQLAAAEAEAAALEAQAKQQQEAAAGKKEAAK